MVLERSAGRTAAPQPEERFRLCVATRTVREPADLIRFVAGPDGAIVPDLGQKLPGRGVWVTADRASVERAVSARAFAKSLKRKVAASEDLAVRVERLLERRVADALAIANKAGAVFTGFDKVDRKLTAHEIMALVHATDAAADGCEKLDRKFRAIAGEAASGRIVAVLTVDQMSLAMGRPNVVHAALNKGGASKRFLTEAERLSRYRSGIGHSDASDSDAEQETAKLDP